MKDFKNKKSTTPDNDARHAAGRRRETKAEVNDSDILIDDEGLVSILKPLLEQDAIGAESLAHFFGMIDDADNEGPKGRKLASAALHDAMAVCFRYSRIYQTCLDLFFLSFTGDLKPSDEPLTLLRGAIERGREEVVKAAKGDAASRRVRRKPRSTKK